MNYYRLLTDDGVKTGDRVETTRWIERAGLDVGRDEFVSSHAIGTSLTNYRTVEYERSDGDGVSQEAGSIRRFTNRIEAIV